MNETLLECGHKRPKYANTYVLRDKDLNAIGTQCARCYRKPGTYQTGAIRFVKINNEVLPSFIRL